MLIYTMRFYFYSKVKKRIEPVNDKGINNLAKEKLQTILKHHKDLKLPEEFIKNWDKVSLYHPAGDINKANAILLESENGAYDIGNKLNHLTGKEWIKFSCSWFIFNAIQKDLKEERDLDSKIEEHPATFSPTMIEGFIKFFTKEGGKVLDPFVGIGSTLEACKRTGRIGYGIELNEKYYKLCLKRTPEFKNNIFHEDAENIKKLNLPQMDFSISSPPYWNILNRSTRDYKNTRVKNNLDYKYSETQHDLGNIEDYELFLKKLSDIYLNVFETLKKNAYLIIIVKNIKKEGKMYPLAWDLAKILSQKYTLKDEKIWIQDKIALAPYGYPSAWASNILHHYCIILQK